MVVENMVLGPISVKPRNPLNVIDTLVMGMTHVGIGYDIEWGTTSQVAVGHEF